MKVKSMKSKKQKTQHELACEDSDNAVELATKIQKETGCTRFEALQEVHRRLNARN